MKRLQTKTNEEEEEEETQGKPINRSIDFFTWNCLVFFKRSVAIDGQGITWLTLPDDQINVSTTDIL